MQAVESPLRLEVARIQEGDLLVLHCPSATSEDEAQLIKRQLRAHLDAEGIKAHALVICGDLELSVLRTSELTEAQRATLTNAHRSEAV